LTIENCIAFPLFWSFILMTPKFSRSDPQGRDRQRSQILGIIILAITALLLASIRFYFKLA